MRKRYIILTTLLFCINSFSQPVPGPITPGAFCRGYLIDYLPNVGLNSGSLSLTGVLTAYSALAITQTNDLTGIGVAHVHVSAPGWDQWFFKFSNGQNAMIDFTAFPYITVRAKTKWAGVKDVPMNITFDHDMSNPAPGTPIGKNFTLKGDGQWHNLGIDYSEFPAIGSGDYDMHMYFNDTCTIDIDKFAFGSIGDPDSAIDLAIDTLAAQFCEKDGGEQTINLSGISNGTDVAGLTLSQTNTKTTIFEGVPVLSAVDPAGTATITYVPKASTLGVSNVHLILTYTRGDSIKKYKSIWFDVNIVSDPVMKVQTSVKAMVNQPKAIMNITNAVNSSGGASNLSITLSCTNTALITNLIADAVKPDGTSKISFIPGQDLCGTDVITAVLTDSKAGRTTSYDIAVEVSSATCVPSVVDALGNAAEAELSISPNPASDIINITMPDDKGGVITVVDITGRNVMKIIVQKGQTEITNIDITSLSAGVYFVANDSRKYFKKLIVR